MQISALTNALSVSQRRFGDHAQRIAEKGPDDASMVGILAEETRFKAIVRTIGAEDRMRGSLLDILA